MTSFYYCQNPSGFCFLLQIRVLVFKQGLLASRHIKVVNASLPVDVRSSKTPLL